MEIDVPARAPLALDAATAAAHARRMGARYALVATPKGGPGAPVELSLIDSATARPARRRAGRDAPASPGSWTPPSCAWTKRRGACSWNSNRTAAAPCPWRPSPAAEGAAMGPPSC